MKIASDKFDKVVDKDKIIVGMDYNQVSTTYKASNHPFYTYVCTYIIYILSYIYNIYIYVVSQTF